MPGGVFLTEPRSVVVNTLFLPWVKIDCCSLWWLQSWGMGGNISETRLMTLALRRPAQIRAGGRGNGGGGRHLREVPEPFTSPLVSPSPFILFLPSHPQEGRRFCKRGSLKLLLSLVLTGNNFQFSSWWQISAYCKTDNTKGKHELTIISNSNFQRQLLLKV